VNAHALENVTCADDVADRFSELHLLASVNNAKRFGAGEQEALLKLGQGMFRLTLLREHIGNYIAEKTVGNPNLDAIEVSLYFRLQLAKEMNLPSQPSSMLFGSIANVSGADIEAARDFVKKAETVEAKAAFLSQQTFWAQWLEKQHPDEFAAALGQAHKKQEGLDARQSELTSQHYKDQSDAVKKELEYGRTRLALSFTTSILKAEADPALPSVDQTGHPE